MFFMLCGSAPSVLSAQEALTTAASDTALLAEIVRALRSTEGQGLRLMVDVRPLRPDSALFEIVQEQFAATSRVDLEARKSALRQLGVDPVDATRVGQSEHCQGIFVGRVSGSAARSDVHSDCPTTPTLIAAIALPRPTVPPPHGEVYPLDQQATAVGYWAVRVIATQLSRNGSAVRHSDYIMRREGSVWRFVKAIGLMWIE